MLKKIAKVVLILLALLCAYAFFFWNTSRKIDAFCNSIDTSTKISDLRELAERAGVEFRGPYVMTDNAGKPYVFAVAPNGFTMGESACRIRGESLTGNVVSKRLGVH